MMRAFALTCFIKGALAIRKRGRASPNDPSAEYDDYDCNGDGTRECKDWWYGGARCANSEYCEYRYKFGDMLLDSSCRCQSRCLGENFKNCEPPPPPTYEWSATADGSHGPCSAQMDEGLPIQLPLVCTGQGPSYEDLGPGQCALPDGSEPPGDHEYHATGTADDIRALCTSMPDCLGYSASVYGGGLIWKSDQLSGGGVSWGSSHCMRKVQPVYENLGQGKCVLPDGSDPAHEYHGTGTHAEMKAICTAMSGCVGYSASTQGGGLIWKSGELSGGGVSWGNTHCMRKVAASGLKLSVRARGWLMSKLSLVIDGKSMGAKRWPIWPATRSWDINLDGLAPGTHLIRYSGRFFDLADVTLQGNGGSCSFDVAPNYARQASAYSYSGLDVLNRLFGQDANWPERQKQQIYFASEAVGRNADGSIDATVVAEGWWQWLYQYSQQQAPNDPWGNGGALWEEARDFTPWPTLELRYLPRHSGQQMQVVEPCNTLSNLAYQEAAVWMTCKVYPFSQDEYASLLSAFTSLAAGSSFFHASGTSTGGRADTFPMDWLMLQQYQILVKQVLADAGSGLTQAERDAILYFGRDIGPATDVAKAMTRLFSQKYNHSAWSDTVRSFDIPAYEMPIAGIVSFVLWSLQGKFPIPGLDSLLQSLIDALMELFSLNDGGFFRDVYTPAIRKALSFSNLRLSAVLPVLGSFLKFIVTFVEALVFQEQQIPVPKPIRDVWGFFDRLGLSSDLLAETKSTWEYYNGFDCRARSDHATWHEKAAYGLTHILRLAELFNTGVTPTSSTNAILPSESEPTITELPDELVEQDPAVMIEEMDTSGDGFLSRDEILRGVQAKWYVEKDVEAFEQQFVPTFTEVFILADVSAGGNLNLQEVEALMRLFEEHSENGDRFHEECWTAGGCRNDGATTCAWCGFQQDSPMYCCHKDWEYRLGHACHNASFSSEHQHRCVTSHA